MAYYSNPSYYGYYPQLQPMTTPMVSPMGQPVMYPQQTQMVEQPQMTQPQTQTQPHIDDSFFIWVQGEAGAKSYPVARGTTVPLFDSEGDYVYFKSVDTNGIPMPLITKVLSDPPYKDKTKVVQESVPEVQVDMSNYVTKEVYDELMKKYSDLETRILELESKPMSSFNSTSTFTGNTFNNTRKDGKENGSKLTF